MTLLIKTLLLLICCSLFHETNSLTPKETNEGIRYGKESNKGFVSTSNSSSQKQKRFLDKVKSKLKKFHGKWKMSKKAVKKLFNVYYECLRLKVKEMEKEEFPIKAILALEGEKVRMDCNVCYRPDQPKGDQTAQWQFLQHENTGLMTITKKNKKYKLNKDNSLIIKDVDIEDAGQYFCLEKHDYAAVYQLDAFLKDKRTYAVMGKDRLLNDTVLVKHNLHVFTMWANWGDCNTCGRKGQKKRVGQCTVKKIEADKPVLPRDYPLMALYPKGIPCHSTALPRFLRHIPVIGMRHSETLLKTCMEECPTEPPQITVTDENGKVIDVLEPGFYPIDSKPVIPTLVKRKVLYEPEASHLVLNCPVDEKKDLIRWMRGEHEVDPATVQRQTQGRVYVDKLNRLHLKPLLLSDTAVFNCWVKTRRVASIKVLVVEIENQEIKMYISYIGLGLTLLGSFLCFCCLCCKKSDKNAQ